MMACSPPATRGVQMDISERHKLREDSQQYNGNQWQHSPQAHSPVGPHVYEPISEGIEPDEEDEKRLDDGERDAEYEMSAELRALNISKFLSSGSESGDDEQISETIITDVYKDPLDLCMEAIEDLATGILRTGKLVINGEPGDMTKIQPALFNLQATDKNLSQLLPQLLQIPFFNCSKSVVPITEDDLFEPSQDEALSEGLIRLGAPVDTAIYVLLRGFCAKGARQAEELINVCLSESYIPSLSLSSKPMMPPIIKFQSSSNKAKRLSGGGPSMLGVEGNKDSTSSISSGFSSMSNMSTSTSSLFSNGGREDLQQKSQGKLRHTASIIEEDEEEMTEVEGDGAGNKTTPSPSNLSPHTQSPPHSPGSPFTGTRSHPSLTKTFSGGGRRISIVKPPSVSSLPRSTSADSDVSTGSEMSHFAPSLDHWNTSIIDNNTIVAQYGELPYPIVWWNPSLKVDFRLSTSVGLLTGNVTGIDHEKPEVTLKVFNKSAKKIGFAIRSSRQSTVFKSHVVYPNKGLETVEPYKSWEDTVEFYPGSADILEMFVIDLFVCTLDSKPSWNVVRKYAIMKPKKSSPKDKERKHRISKRRLSILQVLDGEHKEETLKLVIAHGLQCVVKGKLDEAEIMFSHALYLPDFQRVPLKAFVFICLAVIANKRKKQGHSIYLKNIVTVADASSKLVSVCEQGPGTVRMPRTLQLVKQLKKELNVPKIVKEAQNNKKKPTTITKYTPRMENKLVEETVTPSGTVLAFKDTVIVIPANTVRAESLVSVSTLDSAQLTSVLRTTGWDKVAQVAVAFHIEMSSGAMAISLFRESIHIETPVPADLKIGPKSVLRLMHSNYLRHWVDITNDTCPRVAINPTSGKLELETNLSGWLAVSVIQLDTSLIAKMVLKYISIEPSVFRFSAFGFLDVERSSMQVAVYIEPCKSNEELMHKDLSKPVNFIPISFPHVVQAYPMETLRVEIQGGNFEPDSQNGEESLMFDVEVQQMHSDVLTKWVKLNSSSQVISGKLKVSRRDGDFGWTTVSHMNLSTVAAAMPTNLSPSKE